VSRQWVIRVGSSVLLGICSACVHRNQIELLPGSTPDSLFFAIRSPQMNGSPVSLAGLSVVRCMDGWPMWIEVFDDHGARLDAPGAPPAPPFAPRVRPEPLLPDCYKAIAPGAAPLRFVVDVNGRITTKQ
jgi:hypothetical protein